MFRISRLSGKLCIRRKKKGLVQGPQKAKVPPAPMAHRAATISVSSSPRPYVCEGSEGYSGGLVHW